MQTMVDGPCGRHGRGEADPTTSVDKVHLNVSWGRISGLGTLPILTRVKRRSVNQQGSREAWGMLQSLSAFNTREFELWWSNLACWLVLCAIVGDGGLLSYSSPGGDEELM